MLYLTEPQYQTLAAHAHQTYPEECCGLLLGIFPPAETPGNPIDRPAHCHHIWPTPNAWTPDDAALWLPEPDDPDRPDNHDRRDRFLINPQDFLAAQRHSRQHHLAIIGIYHSHPDHPAHPSPCDRQLAWCQYSYLILSVCQGKTVDYRSWVLDPQQQFQPEAVVVTPDQGFGV